MLRIILIIFIMIQLEVHAQDTSTIQPNDTIQGNVLDNLKLDLNFNFQPDFSNIGLTKEDDAPVLYETYHDEGQVYENDIVEQKLYKKHFLWIERIPTQVIGDSISQLIINNAYAANMPEDEKAAIAYVLTFIDNDCNWENGQVNTTWDNLICKGLSALGLGYQCSEKHISFLTKWFSGDAVSLEKIEDCPHTFPGVTIHTSIKSISLERNENIITVIATKKGYNSRRQENFEWTDKYEFKSNGNSLVLINMTAGKKTS